jgi:ATP-binding cassette subfamily A (ABC1) protein 3
LIIFCCNRVGEYAEEGIKAINDNQNISHKNGDTSVSIYKTEENRISYRNTGLTLTFQQFHGLIMKKILFSYRNPILTLAQLLLPVLLTITSLLILRSVSSPEDSPLLVLDLNNFKGTKIPYFYDENSEKFSEYYTKSISGQNTAENIKAVSQNLTDDAINHLLEISKKDLSYYNLHRPIATIFENRSESDISITALFNNQAYHSPAISLAFVDNAIMRYLLKKLDYNLEVINYPLPRTQSEILLSQQFQSQAQFQIAQNLMFAMSFLAASFSVLLVRERSIKGKHLQQVCGVKLYLFWISSFLWDFITYIIPCVTVMMAFLAFKQEGLDTLEQQSHLLLMFFIHGLALLPFVYALSFMFDIPSTAYVRICLYSVILGIGTFISVVITEIPSLEIENVSKTLDLIFSLFLPNFCLGRSVYNLQNNFFGNKLCTTTIEQSYNGINISINIQQVCQSTPADLIPSSFRTCCRGL